MHIRPTHAELEQSRHEHIATMKALGASQLTLDRIRRRWDREDAGLPPDPPQYILPIPNYGIITYETDNDHNAINQQLLEICTTNPDANLIKYEAPLGITILDFDPTPQPPNPSTDDTIIGEKE